ncbi:MAG: hypothetical protein ACREJO_12095 [Phycisphaerales bacterium]
MAKRLKIVLSPAWTAVPMSDPDAPATYAREDGNGALQLSFAEHRGGKIPNSTESDLKQIAVRSFANSNQGGEEPQLFATASGTCAFGLFGSAEGCSGDSDRVRFWVLSDGRDFIFVTFFSQGPTSEEWQESRDIALRTTLGPRRPWWKFWA